MSDKVESRWDLAAALAGVYTADDEEIVRESLLDWLREDGYEVEAVEDGFKALEKFTERSWDIALIDLKMPKMDGLELLGKIKETWPETQVVIITAFATVNTAVQAMKVGAYDYLVKPFNPEELSLLIKRLVESQSLIKEISYLRKELQKQYQFYDLISKSAKMQKVFDLAHTIAKSNSNILNKWSNFVRRRPIKPFYKPITIRHINSIYLPKIVTVTLKIKMIGQYS